MTDRPPDRRNGKPGRRDADTINASIAAERLSVVEGKMDSFEKAFSDHVEKQDVQFAETRARDEEMMEKLTKASATINDWTVKLTTLEQVAHWGARMIAVVGVVAGMVFGYLTFKK